MRDRNAGTSEPVSPNTESRTQAAVTSSPSPVLTSVSLLQTTSLHLKFIDLSHTFPCRALYVSTFTSTQDPAAITGRHRFQQYSCSWQAIASICLHVGGGPVNECPRPVTVTPVAGLLQPDCQRRWFGYSSWYIATFATRQSSQDQPSIARAGPRSAHTRKISK